MIALRSPCYSIPLTTRPGKVAVYLATLSMLFILARPGNYGKKNHFLWDQASSRFLQLLRGAWVKQNSGNLSHIF